MKTNTKTIEWSYPTSPNADRFKFKQGCWTVEVIDSKTRMPRAVSGHATLDEAKQAAEQNPLPWDHMSTLKLCH